MFWITLYDSAPVLTPLRLGDCMIVRRTGWRDISMTMWRVMTAAEVQAFTCLRMNRGREVRLRMGPSPQEMRIRMTLRPDERSIDGILRLSCGVLPQLGWFHWRRRDRFPLLILSECFIAT